ncbi:hypothetical protein [Streptomyces sp. NBC_01236]|uniref:hypothetical protein n=1 Tax=Streptomyces sp. NBC_01236 TaxID=2903789 RepID=UPI002E12C579|nr:hypothetical protein OG324_31760 [Streptomyces sp. NBC_01236]
MDLRRTMKGRRALSTVAITTALLFAVAGCGGGNEDNSGKGSSSTPSARASATGESDSKAPETNTVLAEVKGESGITLSVSSAKRDEGGFVTVEGTVTNGTGSALAMGNWRGDERELAKNGGSMAGASLVDQTGKKKYLVLRDTEGRCLCTRFDGGIREGQTTQWFAQFPAPPSDTTKVDFQVGSMPPASIEISEG